MCQEHLVLEDMPWGHSWYLTEYLSFLSSKSQLYVIIESWTPFNSLAWIKVGYEQSVLKVWLGGCWRFLFGNWRMSKTLGKTNWCHNYYAKVLKKSNANYVLWWGIYQNCVETNKPSKGIKKSETKNWITNILETFRRELSWTLTTVLLIAAPEVKMKIYCGTFLEQAYYYFRSPGLKF